MSAIKLSTPSSGSISLSPANTASNLTITVPAVTGTMITTANIPTGSVLQVVSNTQSTSFSTSSGTYTAIGLSASITPTSATSKILIIANYKLDTQSSNLSVDSTIFRDSTDLGLTFGHYAASAGYLATTVSASRLDSPATVSSITYSIRAKVAAGAGTISAGSPATITLMEISA